MAWIIKIANCVQEVINFRRPVSRAPPLGEQFLDEANSAREELLAEIRRSAETDVGAEPVENQQADDVTFGHKMMHPAEPDWNVTSEDFADEDLASLLRGDGKSKVDLGVSMHMLKLQLLTAKPSARHRRQTSFLAHKECARARGSQFGGALTSTLSQFGGALAEHAIRGDCGYSAALTGNRF